MSDRLWLGTTKREFADTNLTDFQNIEKAIYDFVRYPGPHKVSGPIEKVRECKIIWEKLYSDGEIWLNPNNVRWDDRDMR